MIKKILFIFLLSATLCACSAKETIYQMPDESKVETQKNLVLPPEYTLPAPTGEK